MTSSPFQRSHSPQLIPPVPDDLKKYYKPFDKYTPDEHRLYREQAQANYDYTYPHLAENHCYEWKKDPIAVQRVRAYIKSRQIDETIKNGSITPM